MLYVSRKEKERVRGLLSGYESIEALAAESAAGEAGEVSESMFSNLVRYAAMSPAELRQEIAGTVIVCVVALLAAVLMGRVFLLLLIPTVLLVQFIRLRGRGIKRAQVFEKDYTALLLSLAAGVRTGLDPLIALIQSEQLFGNESEVRKELKKLHDEVDAGAAEETAVLNFASSINHPDVQLFRTAFMLARKEGSSLANCLQRLARVTRQRQSFRRKIKSAVALQKLSAIGIAVCTGLIGLIQWTANSKAVMAALAHPIGFKILAGGFTSIGIGLIWMFTMTRSRV